jgi:hypothetical protein
MASWNDHNVASFIILYSIVERIADRKPKTHAIPELENKARWFVPCSMTFFSVCLIISLLLSQASLRGLFKVYGEVLVVVAHGNQHTRARGQAFASTESAAKVMKDI